MVADRIDGTVREGVLPYNLPLVLYIGIFISSYVYDVVFSLPFVARAVSVV